MRGVVNLSVYPLTTPVTNIPFDVADILIGKTAEWRIKMITGILENDNRIYEIGFRVLEIEQETSAQTQTFVYDAAAPSTPQEADRAPQDQIIVNTQYFERQTQDRNAVQLQCDLHIGKVRKQGSRLNLEISCYNQDGSLIPTIAAENQFSAVYITLEWQLSV